MNEFVIELGRTVLIFLPAIVANVVPIIAAKRGWLPSLAVPIDARLSWRGVRLLGDNKTVRGFVTGISAAALVGAAQAYLAANGPIFAGAGLGALLGLGALGGDAAASFIKRQMHIAPGQPFFPWDQIDFVLGAAVVAFFTIKILLSQILLAVILLGVGSYVTSYIAVAWGIKKSL